MYVCYNYYHVVNTVILSVYQNIFYIQNLAEMATFFQSKTFLSDEVVCVVLMIMNIVLKYVY